ncbi:hypothetical protein B0H16DRAFT_1479067 [Mycena metata]|uniref:Uncharacterized protein n=1 Tax=Mycena metata TaxID=1033252 RepID=A0AAD7MDW0_9AGAR|nr:hypothetical protein B0H16DRAFT_1479067 [Mycena metata]
MCSKGNSFTGNTLLEDVLPYHALKQRRQEFGFEGLDIEAKKRIDVIERSKIYVNTDIYKSPKSSLSFLQRAILPSSMKLISRFQTLFDEPGAYADESSRPPLQVPGLLSLQTGPPQVQHHSQPSQKTAKKIVTALAEKLEILAAQLRHPWRQNNFPDLCPLKQALDNILAATDQSSVLPTSQQLPPNQSTAWSKTKNNMMPAIKTKRQKAGDPVYGGGESSGSKAPKFNRIIKEANPGPALLTLPIPYQPMAPHYAYIASYAAPQLTTASQSMSQLISSYPAIMPLPYQPQYYYTQPHPNYSYIPYPPAPNLHT